MNNIDFYLLESVQKIIDFQWVLTKYHMGNLFYLYLFMYLVPVHLTLFTYNELMHAWLLDIAFIPAIVLFSLELIQMKEMGLEYFMGMNIIDCL